ncbi:uncharacterized protein TNCV_3962831 [Trichonephila clavipes]|nr:uncharacterized protein TNCV_3962831 [Trichonephila clavipes]
MCTSTARNVAPAGSEYAETVRSNHSTTRGLLATDHVILNHGQVTWTTPELAPPLLTTTPHQREDVSALDRFNVHRCPTRRVFSGTGLELVTMQVTVRYLYHSATPATNRRQTEYSPCAYCGCSELAVAIVSMGKLSDLDAFDLEQIVGVRRMDYSISEIVRELGISKRQWQKYTKNAWMNHYHVTITSHELSPLALTVRDERGLRCIVRCQQSQTLAQITTQLNDGASRTVSKRTVQHGLDFGSLRPTRVPLLNALHRAARLAWVRQLRDRNVEDWK